MFGVPLREAKTYKHRTTRGEMVIGVGWYMLYICIYIVVFVRWLGHKDGFAFALAFALLVLNASRVDDDRSAWPPSSSSPSVRRLSSLACVLTTSGTSCKINNPHSPSLSSQQSDRGPGLRETERKRRRTRTFPKKTTHVAT